ncbi:hypothetical protein FOE78_01690 [Microlunatus elymi]|uniref:Uncharacterized protein n=1 Tax=Microlunatus elymi TaxID=2596828 RepID=A0A516PUG8_9ACTN|nr:hypothetical protein [Microlunatus elymi]QDP94799.1 hypothetical protein FOE78_01690 [Microlunatus elymi]
MSVTVAGLRAWARGSYAEEAAVELLARSFGGRFASTGWPWVQQCDRAGWFWLNPDAIWTGSGALSGGERRLLNVVAALVGGQPLTDLGGILAGLDRQNLALVLAAFAHAGGSHEHALLIMTADGQPSFDRPGALIGWPTVVEAV